MQLSPTYRALLRVIPDLSWIYNFKAQLGRGRCPWVHGLTKTGAKISRFLKKGLIKSHTWLNDSEVVSLNRDRIYTVSQSECSCPEWKHRINKNKGYRHIPGLFQGKVDCCKHQVEHWLRSHDVSNFSSFIELEKNQAITQVEQQTYQIDCVNVPDGISIEYQPYWEDEQTFDVYYERERIGEIEVTPEGFEAATVKGFRHTFTTQDIALTYLLKQIKLSPKETEKALSQQEIHAMRDLFGDDMYSTSEPSQPQSQPVKAQQKWLSFNDLNKASDYGNWDEPDPAWGKPDPAWMRQQNIS